ncbi:hypothetical protein Celaphus_00014278 [Cervus elaphus hippelaphus]|uniref:Small ribosomal subunit protein uS11 n=1 Tax=Cervus elaphus hippelaphus TaxID=46360 RepID=A0A212D514_CEREH|nr:hypothetical protein Celaphus_00014278 [Cervus elaphus hippelaphus]
MDEITQGLISVMKRELPRHPPTFDNLYEYFISRSRKNLHVVLCFSPVGEKFRARSLKFPGLISGCTMDWFSRWPKEALVAVASYFVSGYSIVCSSDTKRQVVETMGLFHDMVSESCESYFQRTWSRSRKVCEVIVMVLAEVTVSAQASAKVKNEVQEVKDKAQKIVDEIDSEKVVAETKLEAARPALEEAEAALNLMSATGFLWSLQQFPKDTINEETVELLQPYFNMDDYTFESAKKVCGNVAGLLSWTLAMATFYGVNREVLPLKANLAKQEGRLAVANAELGKAQALLDEKQAELDKVQAKFDAAMNEKMEAEGENVFGVCHIVASFNRAFVHDTDLSGKETICHVIDGMKVKADRDESSPYAAMLAAQDVAQRCKELGIIALHIKLRATGGNRTRLLDQGLVTSLNHKYFRTHLEDSLSLGRPLLIEDIREELDPALDNVLEKNFIKSGTTFKELESERVKLLEDVTFNKRKMKELEDNLLYKLSATKGSLVDDESLIGVLRTTKLTAAEVSEKLHVAAETEVKINTAQEEFRPAATRGSILYFLITEMSMVNIMYQTSLAQFLKLFDQSMARSEKSPLPQKRITNIIEYLTYEVFTYSVRGLYENHKFLFVLLMTLKIDLQRGTVKHREFQALIKGGAALDLKACPPKPFRWILDMTWLNLVELSKLPQFAEIMNQGGWVLLQNCHLGLEFMEELLETLTITETIDDTFRVWITTEPHVRFPITLLQERRKFGPLGWNIPYEFNSADFSASVQFIQNHLDECDIKKGVSWNTVRYMIGEVQYGGRVTDDFDKRLLNCFARVWFSEKMFEPSFCFYTGYKIPVCKTLDQYFEYIQSLPSLDNPEVFGLHPNADITSCLGGPDAASTGAEDTDAEPRKKGSEAEGLRVMSLPWSL